uniref:Bromo domain-containing protein n=1 Tax=Strigamia maritima TaxID=126957 RepID=T1IIC5_STRMM
MRSGDQNWVSVSRAIKVFGEPNRPADWFSQKNCALQYSDLLEKVETPKRKRGEREIETPGECIVKKLTQERIDELTKITEDCQQKHKKLKLYHDQVCSGSLDNELQTIWQQILDDKKKIKEDEEKHEKWLVEREATRQAAIASMKSAKIPAIPIAKQKKGNKQNRNLRRNSFQSDHGSESESITNSPMDGTIKLEPVVIEETSTSSSVPEEPTKPSPMPPVSPLLTSLLKNPSPATAHPGFGSLQSIILPPKEEPIEKLNLSSSPSAASKPTEEIPPKTYLSPSAGAPTLSRLLELPLTSPGKPLPPLPITSTISTPPPQTTENVIEVEVEVEEKPPLPLLPTSPVPPIDTTPSTETVELEQSTNEIKTEMEVVLEEEETIDKENITNDTAGTEELTISTEKIEELDSTPKPIEEPTVVEEIISFQDEQDVQTNVEIQEENEIEIAVQEDVPVVSETKEPEEEIKVKEEIEPSIEEKPEIPVEIEPPPPVVEPPIEIEEKPVVLREPSPERPPTKQIGTPKINRGKRERGFRRSSAAKHEKATPKVEDVPTEAVVENRETSDKEVKEKPVEKKPIEEKTRGRKPKRRRETKESSEDSNDVNLAKRKQPLRREKRKPESTQKRSRRFKPETSSSSDEDLKIETKEETVVKMEIPFDSIPNSPSSLSHSDDPDSLRDYKLWKKAIMLVWRSAANHKYANVFLHPVTDDVAPGYSSVVYRSMDLSQIKKSVESGAIKTTSEFQRDMLLMFQNAIMYNSSDHDVFHMAVEMQKEVQSHIQDFVTTQLMAQTTEAPKNLRRETRELSHKRTASSEFRDRVERSTPEVEGNKTKKRRTRAAEHD